MKSVNAFILFTSLIAVLAVSQFGFAADSDTDDSTAVVVADNEAGENSEDDYSEDGEEEDEVGKTGGKVELCVVTTGYSARISEAKWKNGQCNKEVTVKGPGIDDVIPVDCAVDNFLMSNDTILVVGGAIFSDTPNTVVVVKGGRCEKRTYSQPQSGSAPSSSPDSTPSSPAIIKMSPKECATIKRTMVEVRDKVVSQLSTLGSGLQGGKLGNNVANLPNIPLADGSSGNGFMNNFRFGL